MLTRLLLLTWFLAIIAVARSQPPQAPDLLPRSKEVKKDFTPARDKLGDTVEKVMVTKNQDEAIAKAEASGTLWIRWTYWPDLYDGSTELFNALPNAVHVLKPDPDGDEYVQFNCSDGGKRWMRSNRIDLVGGKAVAAGIRAAHGKTTTVATHNEETEKVAIDGKIYDKHSDGRLTWCEHCNGGPDPDPAKTARLNKAKGIEASPPPVAKSVSKIPNLTYAEAYAKAKGDGKKTKPLIIWVGGNFCERCVRESENDFVHYFTETWPGMKAPSILVAVWDEKAMYVAGKIDWWIEGDREFGHLASIRDSIRKWRDARNEGKVPVGFESTGRTAQQYAVARTPAGMGTPMIRTSTGFAAPASQPVMRAAPQQFGGVPAGVPRRGG